MTTSPRLGFTYLEVGETVPETAVNEISDYLEAASGHFVIEDRDENNAADVTPTAGQAWLVASSGAGDWSGHTGDIAYYQNTDWVFIEVQEGFTFWVKDENKFLIATSSSTFEEFETTTSTATEATASEIRGGTTTGKYVSPDKMFDAADYVALNDSGGNIAVDLSSGFNFTMTMDGDYTLSAPSNGKPGQTGVIVLTQDGTGTQTLGYASAWKFAGGTDPTLSTAASSVDLLFYQVLPNGTDVFANLVKAIA